MQVLILYFSRTGNTRNLAEAVAKGVRLVEGVEPVLRDTNHVTAQEFAGADAVIAGSPVYFGAMAAELKAVLDKFVGVRRQMGNKIGAAFATSGDPSGGKETTLLSILQAFLIYGMIVIGDPLEAAGHYGVSCVGAPDARTISNAGMLGKRVAALAKTLAADKTF